MRDDDIAILEVLEKAGATTEVIVALVRFMASRPAVPGTRDVVQPVSHVSHSVPRDDERRCKDRERKRKQRAHFDPTLSQGQKGDVPSVPPASTSSLKLVEVESGDLKYEAGSSTSADALAAELEHICQVRRPLSERYKYWGDASRVVAIWLAGGATPAMIRKSAAREVRKGREVFSPNYLGDSIMREATRAKERDLFKRPVAVEPTGPPPAMAGGKVWIAQDTEQWDAWQSHLRSSEKRIGSPCSSRHNGWYFESEWPPGWPKSQCESTMAEPRPPPQESADVKVERAVNRRT